MNTNKQINKKNKKILKKIKKGISKLFFEMFDFDLICLRSQECFA
ncbi:hypothetical protein ACTFIZ_011584 [Dictyostelium cf. discoideum]